MFVSMKDMLDHANEHGYAVMACNSCNMEVARAVIEAAELERSPIIVNISPRQFKLHADLDAMVPMVSSLAKRAAVPVALNLDHGQERADIVKALSYGFTSIMFDGSALPYEENRDVTRLVVSMAHAQGASVEAELGHVGQASDGDGQKVDFFTDVETAVRFVGETGVDALAVAIGTAHGKYPEGFVPQLDFDRLSELKDALKMPLVLHGGSGAGERNIQRAIECGINKINVCTDVFAIGRDRIAEVLHDDPGRDLMLLMEEAQVAMREYIRGYMRMIGSSGRCDYTLSTAKALD
ncbi:MAG: class II fructose-bisphosphate aldolase [Collinsella sp.]|nr:class II fructose-bisphosphate aldolase [Collinsella sp.]